jgi:hypothetical protein
VLPLILQNQNNIVASPVVPKVHQDTSLSTLNPCSNTKTYYKRTSSPLGWVVIHRKRIIKYMRGYNSRSKSQEAEDDLIILESYETSLWSRVLGFGCHWGQQYPYGSIIPSLRVYPVIQTLHIYYDLIASGSIQEIQQSFSSGVLHPLMVDTSGLTLLHV